jgi:hypothetical protein
MSRILSFRGRVADEGKETISLHTNNGKTGYQIRKLQIIPDDPTDDTQTSAVFKIYSVTQATVTDTIDFSDPTLLACAFYTANIGTSGATNPGEIVTIFDNAIINQDIVLTNSINNTQGREMNYYIELEQMDLAIDEATVATLKNIRNS